MADQDVERGSLEEDTPGLDRQPESAEDAAKVFEGEDQAGGSSES